MKHINNNDLNMSPDRINLYLTPEMGKIIRKKAQDCGINVNAYIKMLLTAEIQKEAI